MNIVVIDVLDASGHAFIKKLGCHPCMVFLVWISLMHTFLWGMAHFKILYSRQVVKKHVMDLNHPYYHSDCELDVPRQIIEYDP
jgi:hypothetical protein